jgi:hypothetical protein
MVVRASRYPRWEASHYSKRDSAVGYRPPTRSSPRTARGDVVPTVLVPAKTGRCVKVLLTEPISNRVHRARTDAGEIETR